VEVVEDLVSDPALIPLIALSQRARQSLTVALLGEGSDETNVGYRSFMHLQDTLARRRLSRLLPFAPRSGRWAKRLGYPALREAGVLARFTNIAIPVDDYPRLLPHLREVDERITDEIARLVPHADVSTIGRNRLFRLAGWMKDDLLIKVDKATMAASIEARVPFLDHTYVEWSLSIQDEFVLRQGRTKAVLRALAARLLPERVAGRPQHGLVVPIERLFRSMDLEAISALILKPDALWRRVFMERPVLSLVERFRAGDPAPTFFLYQLVNAELWRERWLEREGVAYSDRVTAA
jgi:asparagine synthase (glutamine-hydrolysing)